MAKKIKKIKSGLFSRSMSLAMLGMEAGAKSAAESLGSIFSDETKKKLGKQALRLSQAAALAKEFGELKGSLMKVGQMLSMYGEHFFPPEINALLKTLHSNSPAVEWEEMEKTITRRLGKERMAKLKIDDEALGAASLGQVHRATILSTNENIVLKVQYPGVDDAVDSDLRALKNFLKFSSAIPKLPNMDPVFAEIKFMLKQELDYELELKRLEYFREKLGNNFLIPKPFPEFSGKRILAMEYLPGVGVDSDEIAKLSQARRNKLSKDLLSLLFKEIYELHIVQTDPHFGNYRIHLGKNGEEDKWILYDFGAVREFEPAFTHTHLRMLRGILRKDRQEFEAATIALRVLVPGDSEELKDYLHALCSLIVEPFQTDEYAWAEGNLPKRVAERALEIPKKFMLRTPPQELLFLDRKILGVFTALTTLRAKINGREILEPYF